MEIARIHTDQLRAEHIILRALNEKYRHVTELKLIKIGDRVWFHRHKQVWREGKVVRVQRPTIHVEAHGTLYPTHKNRIRPFFDEQYAPPQLDNDDKLDYGTLDKPNLQEHPTVDNNKSKVRGHMPISDLVNGAFTVSSSSNSASNHIKTDDNTLIVQVDPSPRGIIDSLFIFRTEVEYVKNLKMRSDHDQKQFNMAKADEIKFLLQNTIELIDECDRKPECELQPLQWALAIKRSPNSEPSVRYPARLVSSSQRTELRH